MCDLEATLTTLTTAALAAASPSTVLRDATVPGLHTRGQRFYLYYRTKVGVERRPKIGTYPVMSLIQARTIAKAMLAEVAAGGDPQEKRQVAREAPTLGDALTRFEEEHLSRRKSGKATGKLLRHALSPAMLARKVSSIGYDDIHSRHQSLAKSPIVANREVMWLSVLFNKCELWGYRPKLTNPCKGIERYPERKRKRYMSTEEAPKIAAALDANAERHPAAVAYIYLMILTGARGGEVASFRWEWLHGNVLHLPDSKTGEKPVYLPPAAMAILAGLPRTHGTILGIKSPRRLWLHVRAEAGCLDLHMHDLRHTFASHAVDAGLSLTQIGELLGHSSPQTTMRYAHLIDATAQAAAAKAAAGVSASMGRT
jgi:integrase